MQALKFWLGLAVMVACFLLAGCAADPNDYRARVLVVPDSTLIGDQAVIVDVARGEVVVRIPAKSTLSGRTGEIQVASRGMRVVR